MPSKRESSFRRSFGAGRSKATIDFSKVPDVTKERQNEKEKLKKCNNRLVNYIEKVHDLEQTNKILAIENAALRRSSKDPQRDIADIYEEELKKLKEKVEDLTVENKKLEIEVENMEYDFNEATEKLEQEQEEKKNLEKEVKDLRKDVDDATIERTSLEAKFENQQETLQLERKAHEIELENLRSQIQPVHATLVENEPSMMPDLNEAIQDVRRQYEMFNTKNLEALEAHYKDKLEGLQKQVKNLQEANCNLREENGDQRKEIQALQNELNSLRNKVDSLEREVADLEEALMKQKADLQEKNKDLAKELEDAKQKLGKLHKDLQGLANWNLSLREEIIIYQNLIVTEETRILDVEVADAKHVSVSKERGRSASPKSREKSRSRSRSKSKSKSRSRSRSKSSDSSRSGSDIVEEMLEADKALVEEKGVVSVTWKVKGGTVRPANPFNSEDDAEKMRNALKASKVDESQIIEVLATRTKAQRMAVASSYRAKYDDDLVGDLQSSLKGDFKNVALELMWKRSVMDANALRKAMKGFGTDESVLIEILCTQGSSEIEEIKTEYGREFPGRSLEKDIASETSGKFKDFLLAVLKADRPADTGTVVANLADADAQALHEMKVKEWTPSNPKFLEIFTQRSFEHLWFLFNQSWPKVSSGDLLQTIESESKGDLQKGLMTLIRFSVFIPPVYYASQLHEAMRKVGTDESLLTYIIVLRSEVDMIDIKEEYFVKFKQHLAQDIVYETSEGDYREILLKLIGEVQKEQ